MPSTDPDLLELRALNKRFIQAQLTLVSEASLPPDSAIICQYRNVVLVEPA